MELPNFDSQGSGPQGTAGIPPERMQEGLRRSGVDLIGANLKPEDSQAAQDVLRQEVESMASQLGIPPQQQPQQQQQAPSPAPDTPVPTPPQPQEQPAAAQPPDLADRIRKVREKYPDFEQLAKAHVHATSAMTRAQQERSTEMAELRGHIENLNAQLAAVLTPKFQEPDYRSQFQQDTARQQPQAQQAPPATTPDQFWADPEGRISQIVGRTVQEHLLAMKEAEVRARKTEEVKKTVSTPEFANLRPVMAQIYAANPGRYDQLPQEDAVSILMEQARDRTAANRAAQFYSEIANLDGKGTVGTPDQSAPVLGSVPTGGTSGRFTQQAQPNGNWSETPSMNRLWKSGDGSVDEIRAVTDVLRERGFGEHLT